MEPATLLPKRAAEILRDAASTPTGLDSLVRRKAVDRAIERIKREYPDYFKPESNHAEAKGGGE